MPSRSRRLTQDGAPRSSLAHVQIAGHQLAYVQYPPAPGNDSTLVFLHEGLGSINVWRDFPAALCARTGCAGLAYDRFGYGESDPFEAALSPAFMHREAQEVLPRLLEELGIHRPVLIGHSDGASIALIYAGSVAQPAALIAEAPHVFVEDVTIAGLLRLRESYASGTFRDKLARHHAHDVDRIFTTWIDAWTSPEFRDWTIEDLLPHITCPTLVIQGRDDEYATLRQVTTISAAAGGPVETLVLDDCRHVPHVDQREAVVSGVTSFLARVLPATARRL